MKYPLLTVIAAALLAATGAEAESLMTFQLEKPIRLEADALQGSYGDERYEAIGSATLRQDGLTLHADRIWFDKVKNEAGAIGNVHLIEESGTLDGEELLLRFTTGTARLSRAEAFLSGQNFRLSGEAIDKLGENRYRVTDGDFTACLGDPPAWKFGASEVDIEVGGYASARNMFFYLHEIPVFYLPYFLYPVKTERESGFLIPHFGFSRLRGAEVALAYYQVLGRNMDATLLLDSYSRAGIGKGLEYRYILGEENPGESSIYHVTGSAGRKDLYAARWRHAGRLPAAVQLRTDLEYVSDRAFLQDFSTVAKDYNRERVESYLSLARSWEKVDLTVQGEYIRDFSGVPGTAPISRLPEAHLAVIPRRIGESPLYLRLDVEGNHLQEKRETIGQTLLLRPAARLALQPQEGISLDLEGGYRSFFTQTSASSDQFGFLDLSARLGARLQRTFANADGSRALRHDIEPELGYLRIADQDQASFPQLIPDDTFLPAERLILALTNRLTSRNSPAGGETEIRERLWLRLSGGYNLPADPTAPETFAPLRGELSVSPARWLALHGDARYGVEADQHRWQTIASGIRLNDPRRDELIVNYYFRDDSDADFLSGRVNVPLSEQWRFGYETRFAVAGNRFLEHLADLEYRGQCWSVLFTFHDRPGDREYLVNFNLAGLGLSPAEARATGTTAYAGRRP